MVPLRAAIWVILSGFRELLVGKRVPLRVPLKGPIRVL